MIRRNSKTRKYQAPVAKVTQMELENSFCEIAESGRFNVQVYELDNINAKTQNAEPMYFEF